jgi:hypothetical protein
MQMHCHASLELPRQSSTHTFKRQIGKASRVWNLNVIIYGIISLEDAAAALALDMILKLRSNNVLQRSLSQIRQK